MKTNSALFHTLYFVEGIMNEFKAEQMPYSVSTTGNLTTFAIDLDVTVPGIKWVKVTLSGGWCVETGKGYFTHLGCRASATIGESRQHSIIAVLEGLFAGFELSNDQPEGVYTKSGSYEYRTQLIRKIERSQLTPLYKKTYRDKESLVYLYQNQLVESYDYGMDYIDETGTKYRIMRTVTGFEKVNGFLLSVEESYRDGYRALHQATEQTEATIEVLHPLVEAMPPELSVGTVVYDTEERRFARLIEVDNELHLEHESSTGQSSWEPFILSSRYEVIQGTPFEVPTSGLYFDTSNRYLYRAVFERPNYLVVAPAHNGTFESRRWGEKPPSIWIVPKNQVQKLSFDYDSLSKLGLAHMQNAFGQVVADLFKRTRVSIEDQTDFWVGLAVEHYGGIQNALHQVYFSLVGQFRHYSSNSSEVTEYVLTLLSEPESKEEIA